MNESTNCQFIPSIEGARIASEFPFSILCKFFEKISSSRGSKKKKEALSGFVRNWALKYENRLEKNSAIAAGVGSFYPVLRLLLPSSDYSRPAYGIGQSTMARICVKAFGLAAKGLSARTLLHFNNPKLSGNHDGRDLADCAFSVLADHCEVESDLTISLLHERLDNIAYAANQEEKLAIITPFVRSISALELKWFVRIVSLRDLHLGLSTNTVLTCLHPAAPSIWNVTQDLCTVCQRIAGIDPTETVDTKISLSTAGQYVNLNAAYRPMLCTRANSALEVCTAYEKIFSGISDYCLCLEAKYDGERVQLHKSGDKYRYWSRSGREWSSSYGTEGNGSTGTLTPRLHAAGFSNDVSECVLDGEMFGFDTYTERFVTKATGFDVKRPDATDGSNLFASKAELAQTARKAAIVPCYIVFDILHLNGELLTHLPLRQRKEILLSIFPTTAVSSDISAKVASCYEKKEPEQEIPHDQLFSLFPIVKGALYLGGFTFMTPDKDRISRLFDVWVSNGAEGLVAKATTAPYVPGGRLRCGWWKLKPDYVLGLTTDLDCLIVGAYFGVGGGGDGGPPNNSYFPQFLCAVRDGNTIVDGASTDTALPYLLSFCRVSNGFTRDQLTQLNKRLRPHWKTYDRRKINSGETEWLKVTAERPDVWIPPRYSVILQIHAAELTSSASYAAGYTLRFPRVAAIREDKSWEDCATVEEIESLNNRTGGKLTEKRLYQADETDQSASDSETVSTNSTLEPLGEDFFALGASASSSTGSAPAGRKRMRKEKSKTGSDTASTLRVTAQYRSALPDSSQIVAETVSFKDKEFCLMLSSDFDGSQGASYTKADLERGVLKASGRLVQNPGAKTTYVIANRLTAKVTNLVESTRSRTAKGPEGGYDILTADWLISSIQEGRPLPLRREHVWAVRPSTKALLDSNYDAFGDSFTEPFSVEGLRSFVSDLQHVRASSNSPCQVAPVPPLPRPDLLKLLDSTNLSHDPLIAPPLLTCTIILIGSQSKSVLQDLDWKMLRADLLRLGAAVFGPLPAHALTPEQIIASAFPSDSISPRKLIDSMTRVVWLDVQATTAGVVEKFQKDQVSTAVAKAMEQTTQALAHVSGEWARKCVRERTWCLEIPFLV